LVRAFEDLGAYVVKHFKDEEAFMESIGYAQLEPHKKIHAKLLEEVGAYAAALKSGTLDQRKLVSFLRNWLISHIMGVDMLYAKHASKTHRQAA
jgi:methyl-accepting chemotaxis protein